MIDNSEIAMASLEEILSTADSFLAQNKFDKALEFYQKALDIREKVLGKDHPETIKTMQRIGEIETAQAFAKMRALADEVDELLDNSGLTKDEIDQLLTS
jgi:tetratricopeptide (TPR) repeat protein